MEWEELPADNKATRTLLHTIEQYYLDPTGLLCHIWFPGKRRVPTPKSQLVIPTALRHEVLLQVHDIPFSGHLGVNKTYAKLRDRYFWPKMYMDVQHYVLSCESCSMRKSPKHRQTTPLLPLPVAGPGERWAVDCLGPFIESTSKNRYIVVWTDYCTRWVECFAVPNIEAVTIANQLVNEIMPRHGAPRTLLSDRGSNFLSSLVKEVCLVINTHKIFTTSYRPQTDGLVERYNHTLAQCISMYVDANQRNWDQNLNAIQFAYRTAPSEVLGESPFFMMYGRDAALPCDPALLLPREMSASVAFHRARVVENIEIARRIAAENTQQAQQRMKDLHDRFSEPTKFQLREHVWVYTPRKRKGLSKKLAHNWHGPYRIVEFLSPVHCVLRAVDNHRVSTTVHVTRLKRYVDPAHRPTREPITELDDPFLDEKDLPPDSFLSAQDEPHCSLSQDVEARAAPNSLEPRVNRGQPDLNCSTPPVLDSTSPARTSHVPDPSDSPVNPELPPPRPLTPTVLKSRSPVLPSRRNRATSQLPAISDSEDSDDEVTDAINGEIYQVEKIVRHRIRGGRPQFLIKWAGFPDSYNTWEPRENILDDRVLKYYFQTCPRAKRLFDSDPDFTPRVATLSWTDSVAGFPFVAVLSPSPPRESLETAKPNLSRQKEAWERDQPQPSPVLPTEAWNQLETPLNTEPGLQVKCPELYRSAGLFPDPRVSRPLDSVESTRRLPQPPAAKLQTSPRGMFCPVATRFLRVWLLLLCFGLINFVHGHAQNEYDATGRIVNFFPASIMIATNSKPLVLYGDTKLISIHMSLPSASQGPSPSFNSTRDPVLAKFYDQVLASIRGVQRTTNRLLSLHGVTDLLECDSYLRRFYGYVSGLTSGLVCPVRHYASSLQDCKRWAVSACRVTSPHERAWLRERKKRSSFLCHMGLAGIPRLLYKTFGGHCDDSPGLWSLFSSAWFRG